MKHLCRGLLATICTIAALLLVTGAPARADNDQANLFARLPAGASGPEGITIGPDQNIYVSTFGFTATGPAPAPGKIYVFSRQGHLIRTLNVAGSTAHLLGLAFHPTTHDLLVIDNGASTVLKVDKNTGGSSVFMTVTGGAGLNALTFDSAGNVYVSDSFQGIIWKTTAAGGAGTAWVTDPLLTTTGVPPFGANGLSFNKAQDAMFVANTGNDTIVRIPVTAGTPGAPAVFVNSINGADGLIMDRDDNIWVCANQNDQIVVLDSTGKLIARIGEFDGLDHDGTPRGLLFPASLVFGSDGHDRVLYVTNLALDIRLFGLVQSPDSQWAAEVERYTVSRINLGSFHHRH
jgi:sugar lactone lactonase YvrE